jgi:hypothetical protein
MVNETLLDLIYEAVKDTPASKPPPGIKSNFVNPPNHAKLGWGTIGACLAVTTFVVLSRMYVKMFMVKKMNWDDWILPVAYVCRLPFRVPWIEIDLFVL